MVKKRTLWLAAAAVVAAVAVAAVAGCKQDDEDDWSPLTIRENVLERYTGQRQTVTVPDDVTAIGSKAFSGSDVTAVIIPGSVTGIAPDAFAGSKVEFISYLGTKDAWDNLTRDGQADGLRVSCFIINDEGVLIGYQGDETDVVIPAGIVKGIAADVFRSRTDITGVTVPGSVRDIADGAFSGCTALGRVHIDAGVARIGAGAFAGCTALESLVIPAGVTEIGGGAFRGCAVLTDLNVHESVTTIAPDAFAGCAGLKGEATKERERNGIFYHAKKIKWEKLLADGINDGLEQALAGFTVHCTDGDWHGPDAGDTEIPGDPICDHDVIMQSDAGGHYERCTRCDYKSATVPHDWSEIRTNDAGEHSRTCMNERCGYSEPVGHTWSDGYKNDADEHYKACTIKGCTVRNETASHVYDSEDVKCTVCGYRKAKPGDPECVHDWSMKSDADVHYQECTRCGETGTSENHQYNGATYENKGTDGHSRTCTTAGCGYVETAAHSLGECENDGTGGHQKICTAGCGYSESVPHEWSEEFTTDANKHYKTCNIAGCIAHDEEGAHDYEGAPYKDDGDGKHYQECKVCKYESDHVAHTWSAYKDDGNGKHSRTCTAAGCDFTETAAHSLGDCEDDGKGGHQKTCTATGCGYTKPVDHIWSDEFTTDADKHYKTCNIAGCTAHDKEGAHDYDGAPYKDDKNGGHYQNCKVCEYQSASVDHTWRDEYTDNKDGTHHTKTCKDCKASVTEEHQYDGVTYDKDGHHQTCTVCKHTETEGHNYVGASFVNDGKDGHYQICTALDCDVHNTLTAHTLEYEKIDDNEHREVCTVCDYESEPEPHGYKYTDNEDGTHHAKTCEVCKYSVTEEHQYDDDTDIECNDCEYKRPLPPGPYPIEGGTLEIGDNGEVTGYTGSGGNITIPEGVTGVGENVFQWNTNIESVIIPGTVTSIGAGAFQGCSLTSVVIPDSVTEIGNTAFQNCDNLTKVTIGNGVTSIGEGAFLNCKKLESVTMGDGVKIIGADAFKYLTNLTTVTIGKNVETIGANAFEGCGLTSVDIPDSVIKIENNAFQNCQTLTTVRIGNGVTSIGADAFHGCTALAAVTIGDHVETIGVNAFERCALTNIVIPDSVTSIGANAFNNCGNLANMTIGNHVETIGASAFHGCGLTSVVIPDSVTSIGANAFDNCGQLTSVTIGSGVTKIEDGTFSGCTTLSSVTIGENVTAIGASAFQGCHGLVSITIPADVTSIGADAFKDCSGLKTITFNGTKKEWLNLIRDRDIGLGDGVTVQGTEWTWPDSTAIYLNSSSGSDTNSGDLLHPFATIQKAVDTVIAMNDGAGEYTIYVDGTVAQGMGGVMAWRTSPRSTKISRSR